MWFSRALVIPLVAFAAPAWAIRGPIPIPPKFTHHDHGTGDVTIHKTTFEQLLDHDKPELGTFSQRYWYSEQFWKGPGSPVRTWCSVV